MILNLDWLDDESLFCITDRIHHFKKSIRVLLIEAQYSAWKLQEYIVSCKNIDARKTVPLR